MLEKLSINVASFPPRRFFRLSPIVIKYIVSLALKYFSNTIRLGSDIFGIHCIPARFLAGINSRLYLRFSLRSSVNNALIKEGE